MSQSLPRRRPAKVYDEKMYKGSSGCLIPAILVLLAAAGLGYFLYTHPDFLDRFLPRRHADVKIFDPSLELDNQPKPVETNVVEVVETNAPALPPEPPPKTMAELRAEANTAQEALDREIEKARQASAGHELPAFAGVRFGDALKGPTISLVSGTAKNGESFFSYLMNGPVLKTPFRKFGTQPLVHVTPKTRRIYRIEFSQNIVRTPGWKYNPETTNLVEMLSNKLGCQPFALDADQYPLGNHEFVFPMGETTLTVGEYGGEQLKLIVEHNGLREAACAESADIRKAALAKASGSKALFSDKYPNAGMVKFGRARMKNGTPKAFGGIVFGSLPPFSAKMAAPPSSTSAKGFYIDYRKAPKCRPFLNFDRGKAETSSINGAVIAVNLYCDSPDNGLTDAEYFAQIRSVLDQECKVKPETKGDGPEQELVYTVGSLEITLGPDPCGGFRLRAVNTVLKELW